jgi:quinol-cytochrome oxidoreductase complex cytochrome b subunit
VRLRKNITSALAIFLWLDDRLALQELLDDVASKYVPLQSIFYCHPSVSDALASIRSIMSSVRAGWLVRLVRASVMVPTFVISLHVRRVYLTGGFGA